MKKSAPSPGLAEAESAIRAARRRLVVSSAADGAARGLAAGAAAGLVVWTAAWAMSADAALLPLIAPAAGALLGAVAALRRGVALDRAALELDAAAATSEAFVSATTARDAPEEFRELSAAYAVERCPPKSVGRFLPFRAPAIATAALVGTALLAALVLVPRAAVEQPPMPGSPDEELVPSAAGRPGTRNESTPRERVERLSNEVSRAAPQATAPLAESVRGDLGSVTNDDLRKLATALAPRSDAARRALAALDSGDRASAIAALTDALGGARPVQSGSGTGTATASASAPPPAAWSAPSWPLRYDRVVRRWIDETAAAGAPK